MTDADENTRGVSLGQARSIWWGVTWRYLIISLVVGFVALFAIMPWIAKWTGFSGESLEGSLGGTVAMTILSALMIMAALRQALLADYGTFSLTVLEWGSEEPGRIHAALGAGRMLRIWWAAAWPLHLVGQGINYLVQRLDLVPAVDSAEGSAGLGCAVFLAWIGVLVLLWIACLWRALRKQYSDFRLVALKSWSEQSRA